MLVRRRPAKLKGGQRALAEESVSLPDPMPGLEPQLRNAQLGAPMQAKYPPERVDELDDYRVAMGIFQSTHHD